MSDEYFNPLSQEEVDKEIAALERERYRDDLSEEIDRLSSELAKKDKRIEELEAEHNKQVCLRCMHAPGCFVTEEQINAAWAGSNAGCFEEEDFCAGVRWGLAELGIVPCEKCGGTKWIYVAAKRKIPCDCSNSGWVKEE